MTTPDEYIHLPIIVVHAVLVCYGAWGSAVILDLAQCEFRQMGHCEAQRGEVKGAATAIPATLLAWTTEPPFRPGRRYSHRDSTNGPPPPEPTE